MIVAMQPTVFPGSGRLHLPEHSDSSALDSLRVAFSFLLLHQKGERGWW
jgi:hypothetical protein